jgi:peroxiredoxin
MGLFTPGFNRKLEVVANLVIVLCGVLLTVRWLLPDLLAPSREETSIKLGTKLDVPGVNWSSNDKTVVLVLKAGCRYCTESAGFYQTLTRAAAESGKAHVLAVTPHEPGLARKYLDSLRLPIEDVRRANLGALNVSGTPTLILLDRNGVVRSVWEGKLPPKQESEVLRRISG